MNYMNKSVLGRYIPGIDWNGKKLALKGDRRLFQLNGDKGTKKEC